MSKNFDRLNLDHIPAHIAIIMDGNGRWAKRQNQDRPYGHACGVESVRTILKAAVQAKVRVLTLYTFSEENWQRPQEEVDALMGLLVKSIYKEVEELNRIGVRIRFMGEFDRLPEDARTAMQDGLKRTEANTGIQLVLAVNYSAKTELLQAANRAIKDGVDIVDEEGLRRYFYLPDVPDPDLLIRTGGECRISNFLLWQLAYSELYFTDILWPDFSAEDFYAAILDYQARERRFGKTGDQVRAEEI